MTSSTPQNNNTQADPGIFNFPGMMEDFYGYQPGEDDDEMFFCQSDPAPLPASSVGLLRNSVFSTRWRLGFLLNDVVREKFGNF